MFSYSTSCLCTLFMVHLRPAAGPAAQISGAAEAVKGLERVPLLGSSQALLVGTWEPACEISFFRACGE